MTAISYFVTGGAAGIGRSLVESLALSPVPNSKIYITFADVQKEAGQKLASNLNSQHPDSFVQFVHADVTDYGALTEAFKAAVRFSPTHTLEHVIANAGMIDKLDTRLVRAAALDVASPSFETLDEVSPPLAPIDGIRTNLIGAYYTAWLAAHYFRLPNSQKQAAARSKSLTLIASTAAYVDMPSSRTTYWASKWGVRGLFHSIRGDMYLVGARVNLVAPYWVKTDLTAAMAANEEASSKIPGGWVDIQDVVKCIRNCSEDTDIDQRAFGVLPGSLGTVDMGDEGKGAWGGLQTQKLAAGLMNETQQAAYAAAH